MVSFFIEGTSFLVFLKLLAVMQSANILFLRRMIKGQHSPYRLMMDAAPLQDFFLCYSSQAAGDGEIFSASLSLLQGGFDWP